MPSEIQTMIDTMLAALGVTIALPIIASSKGWKMIYVFACLVPSIVIAFISWACCRRAAQYDEGQH